MFRKLGKLGHLGSTGGGGLKRLMNISLINPTKKTANYYYDDSTANSNDLKLYTHYYDIQPAATTIRLTLSAAESVDFSTNGIKFEYIVQFASGTTAPLALTDSQRLYLDANNKINCYYSTTGGALLKTFSSITLTRGDWYRFKIEVSGTNLILSVTTPSDELYSSATTQSLSMTETLNAYTITQIVGITSGYEFKGGILMGRAGNAEFWFCLDSNITASTSKYIYSCRSAKRGVLVGVTDFSKTTDVFIPQKYGYTLILWSTGGTYIHVVVPYHNDTSSTNLANLTSYLTYQYAAKEYPNGDYVGLLGVSLPTSLLSIDSGNTFFDSSNVPIVKKISAFPDQFNKQMFFDRVNNTIVCYDKMTTKIKPKNLVGLKYCTIGDSLAGGYCHYMVDWKTGIAMTLKSYAGYKTLQVYNALVSEIAATPTLLSTFEVIYISVGYNDMSTTTMSQYRSQYEDLIELIQANSTAKIIVESQYMPVLKESYINHTPSAGGMYWEDISAMATTMANQYNLINCRADLAGVIGTDFRAGVDDTHVILSGGEKISVKIIEALANVTA